MVTAAIEVTANTMVSELISNTNELAEVNAMSNTSEIRSVDPEMPGASGRFLYSR